MEVKKFLNALLTFVSLAVGVLIAIMAHIGNNTVMFVATAILSMAGGYTILFIFPKIVSKTMKVNKKQ